MCFCNAGTLHVSKPTHWLESRFHFSFANHYDPTRNNFGAQTHDMTCRIACRHHVTGRRGLCSCPSCFTLLAAQQRILTCPVRELPDIL